MRLLIVNHEYPPVGGGASSASWFLARALVQQGHEVSVLTSAYGSHRGLDIEEGVRVNRIPALRRRIDHTGIPQMMCFAASGLLQAPSIVRTQNIERVIAFFTLPSGLVGYWLRARHGLPYLVSQRGGDVPGLVPSMERTHRRVRWLRRRILGSAQAIVANSKGLAKLSQETDPFPVSVIPNGVDFDMFHPGESDPGPQPTDPLRVLFVGRLHEQKNLGLLLDELARLRREGSTAFTLEVAGDGPLAAAMSQRAAQLNLGDSVIWHGWLSKPELIELYQSCDCFVNPSLYEGLPNTVLEAMACGLPVVASRVPGNDVLVDDSETGLLFDLEEPQGLGSALRLLIGDRAMGRRMGAEGRVRAEKQFSWNETAASYLRLFGESAGADP